MGRQTSDLIPFIQTALMLNLYPNIKYENREADIFSITLPRKLGPSNDEWEKPLKAWCKVKSRVYEGYSAGKQGMLIALKKSLYLDFCGRNSKSTHLFRFLKPEEIAAKREAKKKSPKDSNTSKFPEIPNDLKNPPSNASSGYLTDDVNEVLLNDIEIKPNDCPCLEESVKSSDIAKNFDYLVNELEGMELDFVPECNGEKCDASLETANENIRQENFPNAQDCNSVNELNISDSVIENGSKLWIPSKCSELDEYLHVEFEPMEYPPGMAFPSGVFFPHEVFESIKHWILVQDTIFGTCRVQIYKPKGH